MTTLNGLLYYVAGGYIYSYYYYICLNSTDDDYGCESVFYALLYYFYGYDIIVGT